MKELTVKAEVAEITPLTDTIMRLVLVPETFVAYKAGQYLKILFAEEAFSYSIANAPLGSHKYELHIRHSLDNPYNLPLFATIKEQGWVTLSLPFGHCSMDKLKKNAPIMFIAAGTGFAPVKAMIEHLLTDMETKAFELFWIARSHSDLYLDEKVKSWQTHVSRFNYFSLLGYENHQDIISFIVNKHIKDLDKWQIVLSGSFEMVYSLRDSLVGYGASLANLFSDAFEFESNNK